MAKYITLDILQVFKDKIDEKINKTKVDKSELSTVATSGSYNDLSDKPTIPTVNNATLTIQKNGTNVTTFTANSATDATANISVPTKTSELTNDSGFTTNSGTVTTTGTMTSGHVVVSNGGTVIKDSGFTIGKSVPSDAKFTDTVYTHPTTSGNKHIPSGGSSGQILRWSADGTATWGSDNNTTY